MALLVHKEFADELAAGADAAVEEALDTQLPDAVDAVLGAKLLAFFAALPTADPEEEGALWNDAGTLKISAGASE